MSEQDKFQKDTNYNYESGFSRIKFGIDKPILETELNEMQKIQEERRLNIVKQIVPTGFLELKSIDFNGQAIICNPVVTIRTKDADGRDVVKYELKENSIAIAPAKLIVNGIDVTIEGKEEIDGIKGYTVIDLGEAPSNALNYYDFVFLELWFEEITALSNVYKHGFVNGEIIKNTLIDERVGAETSRRVVLKHKIRVEKDIDFDKWPNGFGYIDTNNYSPIYASGPKAKPIKNHNYLFVPTTNEMFKGTKYYNDFGLYIAGRKDYKDKSGEYIINKEFGILENYIFAIPLFKVKRRNKMGYSKSNPNGATKYIDNTSVSDRPDGLFYNMIDQKDIYDLRKTVLFSQINTNKLLDDTLRKLIKGELTTHENDKMTRAQFGVKPVKSTNIYNQYIDDIILHIDFSNQSLAPKLGSSPTTNGGQINYHMSALGYGLSLNGKVIVEYPLQNFNRNNGTIEFFLKPYWDGADENISQSIFSIINELDIPLMELYKDKKYLVFRSRYSGASDSMQSIAQINMINVPIYNNETYHIRIVWNSTNLDSRVKIYINGNKYAESNFVASVLSPKFLRLGKVENINYYSSEYVGCVIDEFIIYSKVLSETFSQLEKDIIIGDATIYNSFNGILTGFQDNAHQQKIITSIVTTVNNDMIRLTAPYGTNLSIDNAKVYNSVTGMEYLGDWNKLDSRTAEFKIDPTKNIVSTFGGEKVWVLHNIEIKGGMGIKHLPHKILKADINGVEMSFASKLHGKREVLNLGDSGIVYEDSEDELISEIIKIESYKGYDYASTRDSKDGFARIVECKIRSNGTNIYRIPSTLFGREVLGIRYVDQPLSSFYKENDGTFTIVLVNELFFDTSFTVQIALGGFTFEYETHTKSLISNIMKATTIRIPTTGNKKDYIIPASLAVNSNINLPPNGGIVVAYLGLSAAEANNTKKEFGHTVYVTGPTYNYFAEAVVTGIGTPFIKISFKDTPPINHFIDIPVLVTYQPLPSEIVSVWYEYNPYQGILTDNTKKKLKRFSDWKIFCTTFGSGKVITNNIKEKSINNASNRLPGGQNYSYLLDGKDINFVTEQISVSGNYSANKKLIFKNQFTDLILNNEFDNYSSVLTTEFSIKKMYGRNYQDAFIDSSIKNIAFAIQDTWDPINKYLGAACLVVDEDGNLLLFVMGEIVKDPVVYSIVRPIHGDLFKLENNPIIIPRIN